ncbi:hypothetical protein CRG98_010600 [Punica granatum]|uniref:Uncharacterized protein n=1 Tax=Punica granatum TaxID=22663 RepID=A0A2I0KKJ5_PUNGR|nr:hypothetical protein CRG98_010600 [Punica granatum]
MPQHPYASGETHSASAIETIKGKRSGNVLYSCSLSSLVSADRFASFGKSSMLRGRIGVPFIGRNPIRQIAKTYRVASFSQRFQLETKRKRQAMETFGRTFSSFSVTTKDLKDPVSVQLHLFSLAGRLESL